MALFPPVLRKGGEWRQVERASSVDEKVTAECLNICGQSGCSS